MREITFVKRNEKKWHEMESNLSYESSIAPDHLSDLFIGLTDDLAYAQTNYPDSNTTLYLNQLTSKVHQKVYRNKKEKTKRIKHFWVTEFPLIIYKHRKALIISFIIFSLSCIIGAFSTHIDDTFVRLILGDVYVDKTIENIENGNPMGIYESQGEFSMFLFITWNNIRVSFTVFAAGVLFSIVSGLMLFYNGVMLGCFQYFFYTKKLLAVSALAVWVHGTLEITAIIIAGGAGIAMGNSIMFPGTYSRMVSFQKTAKESVKIIVGLIPVFIIAGFLEGFVTRHSDISPVSALIVILLSIAFVLYYFVYYPYLLTKKTDHGKNQL